MCSDTSTIPIFSKIQIQLWEQFTITQITSSAQNVVSQGAAVPSLEMTQNHQKWAQRSLGRQPLELAPRVGTELTWPGQVSRGSAHGRACSGPPAPAPTVGTARRRQGCGWAWFCPADSEGRGLQSWLWGQCGNQRRLPGSPAAHGGSLRASQCPQPPSARPCFLAPTGWPRVVSSRGFGEAERKAPSVFGAVGSHSPGRRCPLVHR